jgi:hypothetical protein
MERHGVNASDGSRLPLAELKDPPAIITAAVNPVGK